MTRTKVVGYFHGRGMGVSRYRSKPMVACRAVTPDNLGPASRRFPFPTLRRGNGNEIKNQTIFERENRFLRATTGSYRQGASCDEVNEGGGFRACSLTVDQQRLLENRTQIPDRFASKVRTVVMLFGLPYRSRGDCRTNR